MEGSVKFSEFESVYIPNANISMSVSLNST